MYWSLADLVKRHAALCCTLLHLVSTPATALAAGLTRQRMDHAEALVNEDTGGPIQQPPSMHGAY